ncbi:S1C family serine protease [Paenibacillus radicis (ex Xue et al. 2023)]|uniref:Trypsin-like peptidase domain-containing protein n=1 Tax=Paenibacillus radicis (ex Xue et al. 2023) TaxID=2972489 RepID=A0ABT1YDB1_9BACL|nr:trypsin-like peptidase domain-containing protein [Paenibacillus radicis (ex Xue et al. 2023)]MCR8631189.1 trypsin-like peptidase domain-containing protein [Paenibacillus radicis (ex Xue et al. 2023)]
MERWKKVSKGLMRATAAALLLMTVAGTGAYADAYTDQSSIPSVIQKTTASVVAIIGKPSNGKDSGGRDRYDLAHGTGVIVESNGSILTNAHVVKNMRNINVVTSDGKSYPGKTTHYDEESDLALVKIDATGLTPATFAAPSDIKVGESVMAIGTPLSFALRNSVTYGIVSGMDRSVQSKYQLIQTDAAINPGNSGGALVNMKGQVIGINTLKYVQYGVDGLGFAIPIDTVQHVLEHFRKYGKVVRPTLGLELGESWEAVVGLPTSNGLEVTYVEPDSPAAKAGIKQGDVLLAIDSKQTRNLVQYNEALKNYLPEQKVRLTLQSGSLTKEVDIVLAEDRSHSTNVVQDADGSYIDADQGKTQIGDSHFGWSMKYPAGLIKADQSQGDDNIFLADAKGEFAINIVVKEKQSEDLSPLGLLKKLGGQASDTVLEKRYIEKSPQSYALLVGKRDNDGGYYQIRAFLKGDKIFYVMLLVDKEDNYNNEFKRNSYNDLLDTFVLSFDSSNTALKDISAYNTGNTVTTDYGLTFDVPKEWSKRGWGRDMNFAKEDGEQSLSIRVTSAASGDTVKDWTARQERLFTDSYVAGYREMQDLKEITVGGVPALENRYATTMGDKWHQYHVIYIIKDKYKYKLSFSFPKTSNAVEMDELIGTFVKSVHFSKEAVNSSLGFIQDEEDMLDKKRTVTYTNKKYMYALHVPESWSESYQSEFDSPMKQFNFEGGNLSVSADDRSGLDEVINRIEQEHKKNAEADATYKYAVTDEAMFETTVKKFSIQYKSKNVPYTLNEYVFKKNDIIYTLRQRINDAVKTDEQWQLLEKALLSIQFTNK